LYTISPTAMKFGTVMGTGA